jgi:hypothetical protein
MVILRLVGWSNTVGIATSYGLDGPGIEIRWAREFSHQPRPALGDNPPSHTLGTGLFPGKSGQGVVLTTHPIW